jgi:hypothetical protein
LTIKDIPPKLRPAKSNVFSNTKTAEEKNPKNVQILKHKDCAEWYVDYWKNHREQFGKALPLTAIDSIHETKSKAPSLKSGLTFLNMVPILTHL